MTPKNLGLSVNSEGREMFPTLVGQRLFFASDGMGGLGGLDIFSIDLSSDYEPTGEAVNVGYLSIARVMTLAWWPMMISVMDILPRPE